MEQALNWFLYFNVAYVGRLVLSFLFLMLIYNRLGRHTLGWKILEWPLKIAGAIFLVFDVAYNYIMTIYTFDPPAHRFETVSERLGRYLKKDPTSFWFNAALFWCRILDIADPGHCRRWG